MRVLGSGYSHLGRGYARKVVRIPLHPSSKLHFIYSLYFRKFSLMNDTNNPIIRTQSNIIHDHRVDELIHTPVVQNLVYASNQCFFTYKN